MRLGQRHSPEAIAKLRGRIVSEATRTKIRESRLGRPMSGGQRAQISETLSSPWDAKSIRQRHAWVRKNFPDPGGCEYCGIQWKPLDWANIGHKYRKDRGDWKRLCRRCHQRADRKGK